MEPLEYHPPQEEIRALHQDGHLLVIEKPAGLLSVPGKNPAHRDCVLGRLEAQFAKVLLVHRLDMDTSGLMVFAMSRSAQRHLGLQFERRQLEKTYEALIDAELPEECGRIDAPVIVDWPNRPLQKICHKTGRAAQTDWRVIERSDKETRVRLMPQTGRSHQLRVHLASLGAPIIGDRFYGGAKAERLMLHASRLRLRHPDGGAWQEFESAPPF